MFARALLRRGSLVGAKDRFGGSLVTAGDVVVAGLLVGSITSDGTVTIRPGGRVEGDIVATAVTIGGEVDGTVLARGTLKIERKGRLRGQAAYGALVVDAGAVVEGAGEPCRLSPRGPGVAAPGRPRGRARSATLESACASVERTIPATPSARSAARAGVREPTAPLVQLAPPSPRDPAVPSAARKTEPGAMMPLAPADRGDPTIWLPGLRRRGAK